jgi:hypothetical protein
MKTIRGRSEVHCEDWVPARLAGHRRYSACGRGPLTLALAALSSLGLAVALHDGEWARNLVRQPINLMIAL